MPEQPLIGADTNVLLDLARDDETAIDCFAALKQRLPLSQVLILPTVIHEMADLAEEGETEDIRAAANLVLRKLLRPWGFQPINCVPVGHGIVQRIGETIRERGLIPDVEINDSFIIAEAGLLGVSILLSSDGHLRRASRGPALDYGCGGRSNAAYCFALEDCPRFLPLISFRLQDLGILRYHWRPILGCYARVLYLNPFCIPDR